MSLNLGLKSSDVPLLQPVSLTIAAGVTRTISFPDEFFGLAIAIRITNLDGGATSTFRINGETNPTLILPAGGNRSINDTIVTLLTITAAVGGACQVEAQVLLLD